MFYNQGLCKGSKSFFIFYQRHKHCNIWLFACLISIVSLSTLQVVISVVAVNVQKNVIFLSLFMLCLMTVMSLMKWLQWMKYLLLMVGTKQLYQNYVFSMLGGDNTPFSYIHLDWGFSNIWLFVCLEMLEIFPIWKSMKFFMRLINSFLHYW